MEHKGSINMEITIKMHPEQDIAYVPKALRKMLGDNPKATPNRMAVLLYSNKTSLDDVIKSLDIIKLDLIHAREIQQNQTQRKDSQ